jgi:hypothetical protein
MAGLFAWPGTWPRWSVHIDADLEEFSMDPAALGAWFSGVMSMMFGAARSGIGVAAVIPYEYPSLRRPQIAQTGDACKAK